MVAELTTDDEVQRMNVIVTDVCRAFPGMSSAQVELIVLEHWRAFRDAQVRDFVPLLVRRRVVSHLRTLVPRR
jgi:hypothetical protein